MADLPASSASGKLSSAKEAILKAVELVENENEELKSLNNRILSEIETLKKENEYLKHELNISRNGHFVLQEKLGSMESDIIHLQKEYKIQTCNYEEERTHRKELENQIKTGHEKYSKQIEDMKNELLQKDVALRKLERELEGLRGKLERAARKNYSDRDIELLHEIEMLKNEKRDTETEKDDVQRENKKLKQDLKNLQISLDEKDSELRNENRRHSVLTREFNSLLDENNRLKLQMRRRNNVQNLNSASSDNFTEEKVISLAQGGRKPEVTSSSAATEPTLIINNEVFQPTSDYPLTSREKTAPRRSVPPREMAQIKRSGTFTSMTNPRDLQKRSGRSSGMGSRATDDSGSNSDSLPSLPRTNTSGSLGNNSQSTWNI